MSIYRPFIALINKTEVSVHVYKQSNSFIEKKKIQHHIHIIYIDNHSFMVSFIVVCTAHISYQKFTLYGILTHILIFDFTLLRVYHTPFIYLFFFCWQTSSIVLNHMDYFILHIVYRLSIRIYMSFIHIWLIMRHWFIVDYIVMTLVADWLHVCMTTMLDFFYFVPIFSSVFLFKKKMKETDKFNGY